MRKWMRGRRLGGVLSGLAMAGLIAVFSIAGGLGVATDRHVITIGAKSGHGEGGEDHENGRPKITEIDLPECVQSSFSAEVRLDREFTGELTFELLSGSRDDDQPGFGGVLEGLVDTGRSATARFDHSTSASLNFGEFNPGEDAKCFTIELEKQNGPGWINWGSWERRKHDLACIPVCTVTTTSTTRTTTPVTTTTTTRSTTTVPTITTSTTTTATTTPTPTTTSTTTPTTTTTTTPTTTSTTTPTTTTATTTSTTTPTTTTTTAPTTTATTTAPTTTTSTTTATTTAPTTITSTTTIPTTTTITTTAPSTTTSTATTTQSTTTAPTTTTTTSTTTATHTVGGTLTGLGAGKTVVLVLDVNDALDFLTLNADGPFTFSSSHLPDGFGYSVDVSAQPSGQTCTVANGSGAIAGADVTNVSVTCTNAP